MCLWQQDLKWYVILNSCRLIFPKTLSKWLVLNVLKHKQIGKWNSVKNAVECDKMFLTKNHLHQQGFIQNHRYKIALLKPSTKALDISNKISIRMDNRGFLSLQYMIVTEDGETCYIEYLVSCHLYSPLQVAT